MLKINSICSTVFSFLLKQPAAKKTVELLKEDKKKQNSDNSQQEVSRRASAHQLSPTSQQQESCVSILSCAPFPFRSYLPSSRQFHDCVVPPPPLFFFFFLRTVLDLLGHGVEWGWGGRILHKLH